MRSYGLVVVLSLLIGAAIGFTFNVVVGTNAVRVPVSVQVALIGLCSGLVGAVAGAAIGAISGSRVAAGASEAARLTREQAARDAEESRKDAREALVRDLDQRDREATLARQAEDARLRDGQTFAARMALFKTLDAVAQARHIQIAKQLDARAMGAKLDVDVPTVDSVEDVRLAALDLYRLCDQSTVEKGWAVWSALSDLATLAYDAARDARPDGSVKPLTKAQRIEYSTKAKALRRARFALVQEARREQGLPVLEPRPEWFADPPDEEVTPDG